MAKTGARNQRKVDPKLRMVANCSTEVNAVRAEFSGSIAIGAETAAERPRVLQEDQLQIAEGHRKKIRKLKQAPSDVFANVFIDLRSRKSAIAQMLKKIGKLADVRLTHSRTQATATIRLSQLPKLAADPDVHLVEMGDRLSAPVPLSSSSVDAPPKPRAPHDPAAAELHQYGKGVLIGIIDVQGFDFAHPDFLDQKGHTRFARIWDQGGDTRPNPKLGRLAFEYGAEIQQVHMNKALAAARRVGAPATDIEPQSQMVPGSHGTHVASIAAGNLGVCPRATLAGVLISLTDADVDRRTSFYDSTRLVDAVEYLVELAKQLGKEHGTDPWPVSINISLGTNGHAHDGSAACSRWIDSLLSVPGRCISVAAGNAGQEVAEFDGDLGYVMGRIHTSGRIAASGLTADLDVEVVGNGRMDVSENELEIWYSPQDRLALSLRTPDGQWLGPIEPGEFLQNYRLGQTHFLSVYNELYHPANGANYIAVYLTPFFDRKLVVGVKSGTWTIRLHGREVRDGAFHGWIERDDPRPVGRVGEVDAWQFPSCFSERSNVDNSSISTLACARYVVAVANLDATRERIHITSSQGPTRDKRFKPDVAAPGTEIVAANGFAGPRDLWVAMTGTSMASPYATGVAGLMLAAERRLTAAQILGIMQRTSQPLTGRNFTWTDDGGFGCLDAEQCVREAGRINQRKEHRI